ncbi:unnamed protein product [Rhizoctonia solani]|uniref:Peptidase C14 caspase domain-containing protein n=1 Tax=Rhizoctonia solani TaxID=456999 RepID=A0A8H3D780_9AGAM|nr:unnamed protein product [Rhizoctonia solani]
MIWGPPRHVEGSRVRWVFQLYLIITTEHTVIIPILSHWDNPLRYSLLVLFMSVLSNCSLPGPSWTLPFQARERLRLAILQGDRINQDRLGSYPSKAPRRALLVAIQYLDDPEFSAIEATPYDVLHIYGMLLSQGYAPQDIRILSSGAGTDLENDDPHCMPTRNNIMASLRWLVEDTEAGDYRYFHFSGHGISYESTAAGGKVAQVLPVLPSIPGDYPEQQPTPNTRIELQVIHTSQLKYYNEAIVAHRTPGLDDFTDNLIYDRLSKQSFLTVSLAMDSCHSGRMINNNFKLAGAGLRGKLTRLA